MVSENNCLDLLHSWLRCCMFLKTSRLTEIYLKKPHFSKSEKL